MRMTVHQWMVFLPAALLVAASPGAGNVLALNHGLRHGHRRAVLALSGRFAAFALMMTAVVLGLGVMLATSAIAFTVLKWAGVLYLLYLAIRLWRTEEPQAVETVQSDLQTSVKQLAGREFVVALTNPKAMLLFTAFLPQFVRPGGSMPVELVQLGAAYMLVECLTASGYAFAGGRMRMMRRRRQGGRWLNRVSAAGMAAAAGWLLAMRQHAS